MIGYVCVLSTNDYLEGCLVLNENLKHINSKYELLCLINEDISEESKKILDYFNIKYKIINKLEYKVNSIPVFKHWYNTFDKLNIFTLTEYKKIIYLDSDLLILSNIDELADYKPIAMCKDRPFSNNYNSGVMVVEPNLEDYYNLKQLMIKSMINNKPIGDQNIINQYFRNINEIPQKFNLMRQIGKVIEEGSSLVTNDKIKVYKFDFLFNVDDKKILHYIGENKPFKIDYPYDEYYSYLYSYYLSIVREKRKNIVNGK